MSDTLALVESPVQLLNVLEWVHSRRSAEEPAAAVHGAPARAGAPVASTRAEATTVVILSPRDVLGRGQLRRMAELAIDEGLTVRWYDAREDRAGLLRTMTDLVPPLLRARRLVLGDPFSRLVQTLLPVSRADEFVVVDDGTATMEFTELLSRGAPLVRWHRGGGGRLGTVGAGVARRRLAPRPGRGVEVFTSMPVTVPPGVTVTANTLAWTRARFGPPLITKGVDIIGTSLVETGVVDPDRYREAVAGLVRSNGATRYFAHRRESTAKLHRLVAETGLEVVRPDLPLELVARRGPVSRTILSFPSTVIHTLPLALRGTGVQVRVCDVEPEWFTAGASPRARGFLSGITVTARDVHGLGRARTT